MKTLSYGETLEIKGLRHPYQLMLDQKGYRASRGLPFTDETAREELRRGGRLVGFIAIDDAQKPVDDTLVVGELVQVNDAVYTVTAPGMGDGDSARLILATSYQQAAQTMKSHDALE
jgi:hypothetical protein